MLFQTYIENSIKKQEIKNIKKYFNGQDTWQLTSYIYIYIYIYIKKTF